MGEIVTDTFQFPLCLLAYHHDQRERLDTIISHSLVTTGNRRESRLSQSERDGMDPNHTHRVIECAKDYCGVNPGNTKSLLERFREAESFIGEWKSKGRKTPLVRMPVKLVFEVRDGKGMSYDDFTILCAINAAMGRKTHAVITRPRIRAGMLGYNSGSWLFDAAGDITADGQKILKRRSDKAQPFTPKQLRCALDRLEKRNCFSRFQASRRRVFFSAGKMSSEEIGERLVKRLEDKLTKSTKISELQARLRELNGKGPLNGGPLNEGPLNGVEAEKPEGPLNGNGPVGGHSRANGGPLTGPLNAALNAAIVMQPANASEVMRARAREESLTLDQPAEQIPTAEQAQEFAATIKKNPSGELIGDWLAGYTIAPKGEWKRSLSHRLLSRRKSQTP